jgi:hypothetical protein
MSPDLVFLAEKSRSSAVTSRKVDHLGVRWFYAIVTIARKDSDLPTRQGETRFFGGRAIPKRSVEDLDRIEAIGGEQQF